MTKAHTVLLAFCAGAIIESACVLWVHFAGQDRAISTAICSMLVAIAQISGLSEALMSKHKRAASLAYVIGFGTGTYVAVSLQSIM